MKRCKFFLGTKQLAECPEPATWVRVWRGYERYYCDLHKLRVQGNTPGAVWNPLKAIIPCADATQGVKVAPSPTPDAPMGV